MPLLHDSQIRVLLLDVEGTTTPVEFVTQILFPYTNRNLESFLRVHFQDLQIQSLSKDLRVQHREDERQGLQPPAWNEGSADVSLQSAVTYCRWLIQKDSKCTALKSLQGKIWQEGYTGGELRGQVYPDVPRAFERWHRQGRGIAIYSSGSVLAQRLLFQTTTFGDLTRDIKDFFDTRIGGKIESESYKRIAALLDRAPRQVLFLSDSAKEVDAAAAAGMQACLCDRAGKIDDRKLGPAIIHTFDVVCPD